MINETETLFDSKIKEIVQKIEKETKTKVTPSTLRYLKKDFDKVEKVVLESAIATFYEKELFKFPIAYFRKVVLNKQEEHDKQRADEILRYGQAPNLFK